MVVVVLPTPPFWLHIEITRGVAVLGDRPRVGQHGHRAAGRARAGSPSGVVGSGGGAGSASTAGAVNGIGSDMGGAPGGGEVGIGPSGGISGAVLPLCAVVLRKPENAPSFMCRSSKRRADAPHYTMSTRRHCGDAPLNLGPTRNGHNRFAGYPQAGPKSVESVCTAARSDAQARPLPVHCSVDERPRDTTGLDCV